MKYVGTKSLEVLESLLKTMGMRYLGETSGIRGVKSALYPAVFVQTLLYDFDRIS